MATLCTIATGTSINPAQPETAEYYEIDQVCYVLADAFDSTKKIVAATSFGDLGYKIGDSFMLIAQGGNADRNLGPRRVIGIADFSAGTTQGNVPNRKLGHRVVK